MPALLELPTSLDHLPYFVLRYDRATQAYELIEPNKTNTYAMGDAFKTRAYFERIGLAYLGGRAMDAALAFGASQALIGPNRAFGLDLCQIDLDAGLVRRIDADEDRRMVGDDYDEDSPFISGLAAIPK